MCNIIKAIVFGGGLGLSWAAVEKALVYKAYFQPVGFAGRKNTIMCTKHPGNGLLMWSNGDLQCYDCGVKKYKNKNVDIKIDKG